MHATFGALSQMYGHEVTVWSPATHGSAFAILVPAALLATALLSTPAARCLLRVLVEPPTDILFKSVRRGDGTMPEGVYSPARSPPTPALPARLGAHSPAAIAEAAAFA